MGISGSSLRSLLPSPKPSDNCSARLRVSVVQSQKMCPGPLRRAAMSRIAALSSLEMEELDRFYREGGLRQMASPRVHYHDPTFPNAGCGQKMEWIDFQLELHGDPENIYKPLVRAWWEGRGFAGRCPTCNG